MKKFTLLLLFLSITLYGCKSYSLEGSGKVTDLNIEEVKAFMDDKKTGFLYVKSAFDSNSDKESDRNNLKEIERVAKDEKIDFYVFDGKELPESDLYEQDRSKLIVEQYLKTFAFYQDGELKAELDLNDVSDEEVHKEVEKFVQKVSQEYSK
ncbi:hypothetical protein [Metabacillus sp. cB07]|uniref:hypothetical protein n=1 Tax=Metabacillus sp. cB07 TaxID=2806989 RepID=UPI0019395912|nr:hypothetical protein [Metabacillus sp. cB07]